MQRILPTQGTFLSQSRLLCLTPIQEFEGGLVHPPARLSGRRGLAQVRPVCPVGCAFGRLGGRDPAVAVLVVRYRPGGLGLSLGEADGSAFQGQLLAAEYRAKTEASRPSLGKFSSAAGGP